MRRVATLAVVLLLVASAAACGGGSDTTAKRSKRDTSSAPKQLSADEPGCEYIVAGTDARATTPTGTVEYLTNAVATPTACYDKVSFMFDPGDSPDGLPPAYRVEYREEPFGLEFEGKTVNTSTAGCCAGPAPDVEAVLFVAFVPASTTDTRNGRSTDTYLGNLRLSLKDMEHVLIVEWIQPESLPPDPTPEDQSDNAVIWLIGLDEKRPFTVDFATNCTGTEAETTTTTSPTTCPHVNVLIMH